MRLRRISAEYIFCIIFSFDGKIHCAHGLSFSPCGRINMRTAESPPHRYAERGRDSSRWWNLDPVIGRTCNLTHRRAPTISVKTKIMSEGRGCNQRTTAAADLRCGTSRILRRIYISRAFPFFLPIFSMNIARHLHFAFHVLYDFFRSRAPQHCQRHAAENLCM